jgi:DNA-binding NtrC family response regulator
LDSRNAAMRSIVETVEKILDRDANILILGESGVGKDYLASAIHACGPRRDQPFVHVECAAIPAELFESEIFGHERGTFTDAHARKVGKLEMAGRGTVYFDGITALPSPLQAKLLRAIQERRFARLGGASTLLFHARVISSSSLSPAVSAGMPTGTSAGSAAGAGVEELLASGALRRDLYYRINVVTLTLPPLRERAEDILPLAKKFLRSAAARRFRGFDPAAERLLAAHPWPGNVRELRNAIERATLLEEGDLVTADSLPIQSPSDLVVAAARGAWTLDELESHYIRQILRLTRSNYTRAAQLLGINRKTLLEKRKRYGLEGTLNDDGGG